MLRFFLKLAAFLRCKIYRLFSNKRYFHKKFSPNFNWITLIEFCCKLLIPIEMSKCFLKKLTNKQYRNVRKF